jgi:DNA (cytosine-5)-methyltransferase 1
VTYRLLDLGCCIGGASRGYEQAGFEVIGVDIVDRPRYPGEFIQADALTFPLEGWDAIHWSAPCQRWAQASLSHRKRGKVYPDLITPMRPRLIASGIPYVMENVPKAPLRHDLELCGCMFRLEIPGVGQLRRLRKFELSWQPVTERMAHRHVLPAISIAGHGTPAWQREITGHIGVAVWRQVMGIDWPVRREELTEAIPPAYTKYVGGLLRTYLDHAKENYAVQSA